jgi:hypothetical protein
MAVNTDGSNVTEPGMESDVPPPVFRSFKRRRLVRQSNVDDAANAPNRRSEDIDLEASNDASEASVIPPSRWRKFRSRNMGLDVSTPSTKTMQRENQDELDDPIQSPKATIMAPIKFAPQTGLVKDDLDKHM